jgi:hypothetical protein
MKTIRAFGRLLEHVSSSSRRKRALASFVCRAFCRKPVTTFRESALAVVTAGVLLAGCAFDGHNFEQSTANPPPASLSGSRIYVYSMLDFRASSYGPRTLAEFERQLVDRFAAVNVTAKVTNFRSLPIGRHYLVTDSSATVSIHTIIEQGRADETAFGAQYRLFIHPTYTSVPANDFKIQWQIQQISDGRMVWSGRSRVHTDYIWSTDGLYIFNGSNVAEHAKYLLDPFFAEITARGLFRDPLRTTI